MPKRYRPSEIIRALESAGWGAVSQRGSHVKLVKAGERNHVVISMSSREVPPGTFKAILRQATLSVREFEQLVGR
jgi:predicted RNA binding protein YcfA (HicA-like mRNA interferase family)